MLSFVHSHKAELSRQNTKEIRTLYLKKGMNRPLVFDTEKRLGLINEKVSLHYSGQID